MSEAVKKFVNKVTCGDCLKLLKELPDNSVDLVVTDPPYNIGIDEWDTKLSIKDYIKFIKPFLESCFKILRKNGSLYIFGNFNYVADIKCLLNNYDCKLIAWIIWDKGSKKQNAIRTYADVTEHLLYYIKGVKKDLDIFNDEWETVKT